MTPEGKVKKQVKAVLKDFGSDVYSHWPVQVGFGEPTLDCIGSVKTAHAEIGVAFAIETKAPGGKMTERQKVTAREMRAAGVKVWLIGSREGLLDMELRVLRQWLLQHASP